MSSDMWDARYAETELVWSREPNLYLPPLVDDLEPGRALDLACGEGRNAIWLAKQGWDVTGVDYSAVAIDKAKSLTPDLDVEWVVGDATAFTSDATFDLVMLFYLHLPEAQMAMAFERAIDALSPGGTLFGVGHALRNLTDGHGGPPIPEILWTHVAMQSMLSGVEIVELDERERPVADTDAVAIDIVLRAVRP